MGKRIDLTGQRFFRLTVIALARRDARGQAYWLCKCDCENEVVASLGHLRSGHTLSCGCWSQAVAMLNQLTHGQSRGGTLSPEYNSWRNLIQRCTNPKRKDYADYYGGRGITVCDRWKIFANFLTDMGRRPEGTSLDRFPNNDGNYEPGNCRWATRVEQRANRRARRAA